MRRVRSDSQVLEWWVKIDAGPFPGGSSTPAGGDYNVAFSTPRMRPQTILIVDDSSSIRSILKVYLMGLEAEVLDAESGERALKLARLLPLSLMIVDINMPGMDGLTLVDKVRHDSRASV